MNAKPPPLPPLSRMANNLLPHGSTSDDTRRSILTEQSNCSTLEREQKWLIYSLAAFLLLLAVLLFILSVRVKLQRSGAESIDASGDSKFVREASISSPSGSIIVGEVSLSESDEALSPHDPSEMQSRQNADTENSKVLEDTEALPENESDVKPESNQTSESVEIVQPTLTADVPNLPTIPKFSAKPGRLPSSLVSDNGLNPFFASLEADSIVFVIDRSGSMSGSRLPRVITALNETLDRLRPEQKFLLMFFCDSYELHPSLRQLVNATDSNKRLAIDWTSTITVASGTVPIDAMLYAINQNPQRIVLLSDGEFDPSDVALITEVNRKRANPIRIDGIGLEESVLTLQALAESNQGIYYSAN